MAWDKGFNFRGTSGYVTDGANETYVLLGDAYPVTRNGVTFGWLSAPSSGDRDSTIDRRLAGINYTANDGASQRDFQIDLPAAGDYIISLALGDHGFTQTYQYWRLLDNTTVLATIADTDGTPAASYERCDRR